MAATELPITTVRRASTAATLSTLAAEAVLALAAAALVAGSFLSYAVVKHRLDAFASDHDANLTAERFATIVWQARAAAACLAALAIAVHLRRRRVAGSLDVLGRSARADAGALAAAARNAVAAESRLHVGAFATILLAAFLVRLDFLFQPMRYDEADTYVHYASRPLYIGLTAYTAPNNHVLHTLLVHVSTLVFGASPWAVRLPAFAAGVAIVPAAYVVGRVLYGSAAALLAAALVATSSTLVEYSTNARGYTLVVLLTLLLTAVAVALRRTASPAAWTAFAVVAALGLWTIPTMLYAIVTVVAWLVAVALAEHDHVRLLRTRLPAALVGAAALAVVLYVPVLAASGIHALAGNDFVTPHSLGYVWHHLPTSLAATFRRWHRDWWTPVWIAVAAGFVLGTVVHRRISRVPVPPALGVVAAVPFVLAQRVVPFERVWLFALPLYLCTAAGGLSFLAARLGDGRAPRAGATVAVVALAAALGGEAAASRAVYRSEDTSTFRDAPAVAAYLERVVRPADRVLAAPPADQILEYYLDVAGLDAGSLLYGDTAGRRLFAVVKEGPREYGLPTVLRRRLSERARGGLRPIVLARFPHSVVYALRRR